MDALGSVVTIKNVRSKKLSAALAKYEVGLAQLRQGLTAVVATGQTLARATSLVLLVEAAAHVGQIEEGLRLLAEARTVLEAKGLGTIVTLIALVLNLGETP